MMFRRFHHGHSAGLGFLLALALYQHALVFALGCFTVGLIAGRAWGFWALAADALRNKWHLAKRERITSSPQPVYSTRARRGPGDLPEGF